MKKLLLLTPLLPGIMAAASYLPPTEGSYTIKNLKFVPEES
jgi:hypothetical protein